MSVLNLDGYIIGVNFSSLEPAEFNLRHSSGKFLGFIFLHKSCKCFLGTKNISTRADETRANFLLIMGKICVFCSYSKRVLWENGYGAYLVFAYAEHNGEMRFKKY